MTRRLAVLLALGILAVAFPSCPEDDTEVTVAWRFGETQMKCRDAHVQTVHVFVGPLEPSGSYDHEVECEVGETGLRLAGVSPGPHAVVIKGTANNRTLFLFETELDIQEGADLGTLTIPVYIPPPSP
jgi:hypothetical protein